jgi:large repetitive protein
MLEPRKKKRRPNKWAIVIPILLVLISSVLVFSGRVLSEGEISRKIILNEGTSAETKWNIVNGTAEETWITSGKVEFVVDMQADYENANKIKTPDVDNDIPFDITESNGNIPTIKPIDNSPGKYLIGLQIDSDSELNFTLEISPNNNWGITDSQTFKFNVIKDSTAPEINFSGVESDSVSIDKANLKINIKDTFLNSESIKTIIKKDGELIEIDGKWVDIDQGIEGNYEFISEGDYTISVSAESISGVGKDRHEEISFSIWSDDPDFIIYDLNQNPKKQLSSNAYSKTGEVLLEVDSLISRGDVLLEIQKDGTVVFPEAKMQKNGSVATLKHEIKGSGKYEFNIRIKHKDSVLHSFDSFVLNIDQDPPGISVDGVSNGDVTNQEKSFQVSFTDYENAEGTLIRKSFDGGTTSEKIKIINGMATIKVDEEEGKAAEYTLILDATDNLGNVAPQKNVKFIIDKVKPNFIIKNIENNGFYKEVNKAQILLEDLTLDLEGLLKGTINTKIDLTKDSINYPVGLGSWNYSLLDNGLTQAWRDLTLSEEGVYKLTGETMDLSGNPKEMSPIVFEIDNTKPVVDLIQNDRPIRDNEIFTQKVKAFISISDKNIDKQKTQLIVKRNNEIIFDGEGDAVPETYDFNEEGLYNVKLISFDKANNPGVKELSFTVDTKAPDLDFSGNLKNLEHYNGRDVDLIAMDTTLSIEDTTIEISKDGKPFTIEQGKWDIEEQSNGLKVATKTLQFLEDGDYYIKFTSKDVAGNPLTEKTIEFTIDNKHPIVDISGIEEGAFVQTGKTVKVKVKEHNYEKNDVSISVTRDKKKYDFGVWHNFGEESELSHTFIEDGDYEIKVEAIDGAKNEAKVKMLRFTVDNIKPKIDILGPKQNSYHNTDEKVNITVEEHNFANNKVDIKVTRKVEVDGKPVNYPIDEWENVNEVSDLSHLFDRDGEYEITVEATDAAGNKGLTEKLHFTIDKTDPKVELETDIVNGNNYRKNMLVSMKAEDRNIDLSNTILDVEKNGKPFNVGKLKLLEDSKTVAYNSYTFFEEGSYVINLRTKDKAGNTKKHDQLSFIIDKTNPVVKIDGVENNSFNPENKNVTISIDELNFKTNNVSVTATKDGALFNIGNWDNTGKLSKLGYNFTRDGLYTILATAEDKAGNGPIAEKRTFTIDRTKPSIEITGVENNAYYNVDKPVNATIKDVNLDINKITVTRNGARYNAGSFSVNGDLASFRHNFSGEGEYNIVVEATDKAGNSFSKTMTFTIDKTKPIITPKFKGQNRVIKDGEYINEVFTPEFALDEAEDMIVSATLNNGGNLGKNIPVAAREMSYTYKVLARDKAGNESTLEISFTLDTTKPMLNISGVLDGFFNKDIAPKVTYSDVHLDQSKTSVTLNGKPFENGTNLEYEQDYILKAVVTDLAKNISSRTIVFTIDKTSPVIKFKEPISNKYFNTDLLPQLLIEDMSSYDIIAMMLDGKPYEAGDPIKEEGKHVMFFEVKDKAGNIQQLSVEFIIDKTAPKVVYEGVKNKEKYYDPVDISIRLDNPNDKIKSVMINGKIFDGEVVEENGYKVIKTTLAEIKPYEITVTAYDDAENEKTTVISFEIVEKGALVKFYENKPLLGGTLAGVIGLVAAATTVLVRRRRMKVE